MCGIAGFIGKGTERDLKAMIQSISYRGPDHQGTFLGDGVGLAHARLSIIDLSPEAHQPFFSQDHSIAITFNGEIYNFIELRETLLRTGRYAFRTRSDTEVLIYLYEEYGTAMLGLLNGMFAFGIWDFRKRRLLMARDRMGKKPLFYAQVGDNLIFASELKAIQHHPLVSSEVNLEALNEYLTFE
jgi:asparagine synthase (glutamine-hydrolysing)